MITVLPPNTRCVVHIGRHKTGTSSLQRALNCQGDQLAESGYRYANAGRDPDGIGRNTMIAHHRLAGELRSGELSFVAEQLKAEISEHEEITVVSSEALQNIAPEQLARLFAPEETLIVVYLREQVSYLLSAYAQRVQANAYCAPSEEYIETHLKQLNYVPGLDALAGTFGSDRVIARAYDPTYLTGGNTVSDFYTILGVAIEPPPGDGNPSINANTVFVKRLMNVCGIAEPDGLYNKLPELTAVLGGPRHVAIGSARQAEIRARYVDANLDLFNRYIGIPGGSFTTNDYAYEDTRYTQDDVIALIEAAFDALGVSFG